MGTLLFNGERGADLNAGSDQVVPFCIRQTMVGEGGRRQLPECFL